MPSPKSLNDAKTTSPSMSRILSYTCLCAVILMALPLRHQLEASNKSTLKLLNKYAPDQKAQAHSGSSGFAVVLGQSLEMTRQLHQKKGFRVHALVDSDSTALKMREQLLKDGLHGPITVLVHDGQHLPYIDNFINVLVAIDRGMPKTELMRALAPRGVLIQRGKAITKPVPKNIDDWTHYLHNPGGNPVSTDTAMGIPNRVQWRAKPNWGGDHDADTATHAMVSAKGRVFAIVNDTTFQIPSTSLDSRFYLTARDAFNGSLLWKIPIKDWGWKYWKTHYASFKNLPLQLTRRLVAIEDRVYVTLGYNAPISVLDAKSGETLRVLKNSERTDELIVHGGKVIAAVNSAIQPVEDPFMERKTPSEEYHDKSIMAWSTSSGRSLWRLDGFKGSVNYMHHTDRFGVPRPGDKDKNKRAFHRMGGAMLNIVADKNYLAFGDQRDLVCVDLNHGRELWRETFVKYTKGRESMLKKYNIKDIKVGALGVVGEIVYVNEIERITGFRAKDGEQLWQMNKSSLDWTSWKDVFIQNDNMYLWSKEETSVIGERSQYTSMTMSIRSPAKLLGFNVKTGHQKEKAIDLNDYYAASHHHRCYQNKMSGRYVITGRLGTEFIDIKSGQKSMVDWLRGTCSYGLMPANGLLITPPNRCWCMSSTLISGFNALASTEAHQTVLYEHIDPQTTKVRSHPKRKPTGKAEWPTLRGNNLRNSVCDQDNFHMDMEARWTVKLNQRLSSPTVANDTVYFSEIDNYCVKALDLKTGREKWTFPVPGIVDSPPSVSKGLAVFGSKDGSVYALDAAQGHLIWRFDTSKRKFFHGDDGHVASVLRVHGSVLIENDCVYFAAGDNSYLDAGVLMVALDLYSGKLLKHRHYFLKSKPLDTLNNKHHKSHGMKRGIPSSDGETIYIHNYGYDSDLNHTLSSDVKSKKTLKHRTMTFGSMLDPVFNKRGQSFLTGGIRGDYICSDRENNMFYSIRAEEEPFKELVMNALFVPEDTGGFLLEAKHLRKRKPAWSTRQPIIPSCMVVTERYVLLGGSPDIIDPEDSLKNYEHRGSGLMFFMDKKSGELLKSYDLDTAPNHDGIAIVGGELVMTTQDGQVCVYNSSAPES